MRPVDHAGRQGLVELGAGDVAGRGAGGGQVVQQRARGPDLERGEVGGRVDLLREHQLRRVGLFGLVDDPVLFGLGRHQRLDPEILVVVADLPVIVQRPGDAVGEGRSRRDLAHVGGRGRPRLHHALAHDVIDLGALGELAGAEQLPGEAAVGLLGEHVGQHLEAAAEGRRGLGPDGLDAPVDLALGDGRADQRRRGERRGAPAGQKSAAAGLESVGHVFLPLRAPSAAGSVRGLGLEPAERAGIMDAYSSTGQ